MENISVAIDGPAGAGKSTIAKKCAAKLNYVYVDTGAMYRAITYKALQLNIDITDETKYDFIDNTNIQLTKDDRVIIDEEDVTRQIRERDVTNAVSIVSSKQTVREKIVPIQRAMAQKNNIIMDGRDIGTNVLKNATVKIYLTASVEERAKRRYNELKAKNPSVSLNYDEIKADIIKRDYLDTTRKLNPLVKANDAIEVDTSLLTIDEVVNKIIGIILGKVNSNGTKF